MKEIDFLRKEEYIDYVKNLDDGHWTKNTIVERWDYHYRAIELIKSTNVKSPKKVLEMGTMGVSCVKGSDTIDFDESWDFKGKNPTYNHDARVLPWPINENQYEVFVALRVFQHLVPGQPEAVKEAFRIARKVLMVVPEYYDNPVIPDSRGIAYDEFVSILDGIHPNVYLPTAFGSLFYWDTENPSYFSLNSVMKNIKLFEVEKVKRAPGQIKEINSKVILKRILKKIIGDS